MSDASLTNLRMVRPKGPKIFFGVLAVGAVGVGAWWWLRPPGPVGEREDPAKLLVIGEDPDVATTLGELGLSATHGTFEALAAEGAKAEGGADKQGIAAILHLADTRGIGYVALHDPAAHDIGGLTVTADSADVTGSHGWAVFSVGELGMPPKVTVDGEPSELPLPGYVQVLRAAFAQDRLAGTLFAESQLPMDAVDLHRRIEAAVALHSAYAMLDRRVAKDVRARTEALVDGEQAATKPVVLASALETTDVLPLADGTVLSLRQGWRLESPREPEVSLQPSAELELWYHPPGSTELAQRQRCGTLRGGSLALSGAEWTVSPAADALLLEASGGFELWVLDVAAGACAFTRKGIVPRLRDDELSWGEPHASGRVLRPASAPEGPRARVWTAGSDAAVELPLHGCTQVGEPVWIDGEHVAVSCAYEPPAVLDDPYDLYGEPLDEEEASPEEPLPPPVPAQSWIYLVRIADGQAVAIPGTVLGEHTGTHELRVVPSGSGIDLLAPHPWGGKVLRLRSEAGVAALFEGAAGTFAALSEADAKAAAEAEALLAGGEPVAAVGDPADPAGSEEAPLLRPAFVPVGGMVAALPSERFTVATIDLGADFDQLAPSPDGTRVVYTTDHGHEVRVMTLDGGAVTTVSSNAEVSHRRPGFTADGAAVVFTSEFDGNDRFERVGQRAALGGS